MIMPFVRLIAIYIVVGLAVFAFFKRDALMALINGPEDEVTMTAEPVAAPVAKPAAVPVITQPTAEPQPVPTPAADPVYPSWSWLRLPGGDARQRHVSGSESHRPDGGPPLPGPAQASGQASRRLR